MGIMKVGEVIENLQKFDPEQFLVIQDDDFDMPIWKISDIERSGREVPYVALVVVEIEEDENDLLNPEECE